MDLVKIILLIKAKNRQAEKTLFLRYAPFVMTICRRYSSQKAEADDFLQECFILTFSKINQFDQAKGAFEGWLHRLCTNRILQLLRKSKNEIKIYFPEKLPEQELTESEFEAIPHEDIIEAIQKLPTGYKEVFNLYIFDGWSHKEISNSLNIAETTSRSQLTRAKKMLKLLLQSKNKNNYERKLA